MIGQQVGDYRITDLLGEGGMGMVYRAVHTVVGQVVAVKSLHPTLISNDSVRKRFEREAQALARLNHPNIVRLLSYITSADGCYIIMEFTEGETIEDKLARDGLVPCSTCLPWFVKVLEALSFAHDQGVVHRDIKPSNIIIGRDGSVKLLDFGTAKLVDAKGLTRQGMTLGTFIYMSPEQILGRKLDHRSDQYSLAVTVYETTTGKLPFYDESEAELVKQIVKAPPDPPSQHGHDITPTVDAVLLKALAKVPTERFADASAMQNALLGKTPAPPPEELYSARGVSDTARSLPPAESLITPPQPKRPGKIPEDEGKAQSTPQSPTPEPASSNRGLVLLGSGIAVTLAGLATGLPLVMSGSVVNGAVLLSLLSGTGVFLTVLGILEKAPWMMGGHLSPRAPTATKKPHSRGSGSPGSGSTAHVPQDLEIPADAAGLLYVVDGNSRGTKVVLADAVSIGRAATNLLVLQDTGVSAAHCGISRQESGTFLLRDLGSRNGTWLNKAPVKDATPLTHGDEIIVGNTKIQVALARQRTTSSS